ncbi:MAG: GxxExxY protein [Imperialibacter sp.]|jgi:GxxExxY protein|uniref:GxxExxY protein n=1 Tax=Imperialibacter sp. TaxID=2038411 RepID=UPI003A8C4834
MTDNQLTEKIIGCAIKVHKALGPGLLESSYQECLYYELVKSGLYVEKEKSMPLIYDGVVLECGYRIDLFVEKQIIVEIKAVTELPPIALAQVLTYLKLAKKSVGLIINFNVSLLTDGLKRVVNKYA